MSQPAIGSVIGELVLTTHYRNKRVSGETESEWYCGVTGQPFTNDEFELERIEEHSNGSFEYLDTDSIGKVKVVSIDEAMNLERKMGIQGFDIGFS